MFILIDKPKGITSHDVVDHIRKITGEKRVGHAGTLDPNATGLLIVGIGREFTRELWTKFGKLDKTYIAEITLGEERETDDILGNLKLETQKSKLKLKTKKTEDFRVDTIRNVLRNFEGEQMQIPPVYSAIKIKGETAYGLARKGKNVTLEPRKITIYKIKLLKYEFPVLNIEVKVSSGTYIRALARDIGRKLRCGAYLSDLRRTKVGKYLVKNAVTLSEFEHSKDLINLNRNIFDL